MAFLLLLVFVKILDNKISITAKAQGLILSANAAGSIIPKNLRLLHFDVKSHFSDDIPHDISFSSISPQFK